MDLAEGAGLLHIAQRAHYNLGTIMGLAFEDTAAELAAYHRATQIARQRGSVHDEASFLDAVIDCSCLAGDLDGAREALERMRIVVQLQPASLRLKHQLLSGEANWLRHEGSLEQAILNWQACAAYYESTDDPPNVEYMYLMIGWVFTELGSFEQAEAALARFIQSDNSTEGLSAGVLARAWLSQAKARQGRVTEADRLLREAETMAGPHATTGNAYLLHAARAWLAAARSEWESAFSIWQTIRESHRQAGCHWLANYVCLHLADIYQLRAAPGDRELARAALAEAQSAFKQMGANSYVARLQARLDALDTQSANQADAA